MASVIEQSHDEYGPIWPKEIAPYHVHICALNFNQEPVRDAAEKIYGDLTAAGIETLLDDRNEKAGYAFNDADLIGVPYRVVLSPKTLAEGCVELKARDKSVDERIMVADLQGRLRELLK